MQAGHIRNTARAHHEEDQSDEILYSKLTCGASSHKGTIHPAPRLLHIYMIRPKQASIRRASRAVIKFVNQ